MTRSISPTMAGVLERLELERPVLVTGDYLAQILEAQHISTPARVVAARLREKGWLLPTAQRGVWEFAPAETAGPISRGDPTLPLQSFLAKHPDAQCALTFQAAAWAYGHSDRVPAKLEIAAENPVLVKSLPPSVYSSVFTPCLSPVEKRSVPVLARESVLVHMAAKPNDVRSWTSAREWFPDLAAELDWNQLEKELQGRTLTVRARTGYLLQSLRPDLADRIFSSYPPTSKTWFGPRGKLKRHDNHWLIADTLLPFDPSKIGDNNERY